MANTTLSFTTADDEILANLNWLPLANGDTITFDAPAGNTHPVVFFSPDLISILTPTPPPHLVVDNTVPPVFTVSASRPGSYTLVVSSSAEFPPYFPERSSNILFLQSTPVLVGSAVPPPVRAGS